MSDAVLDDEMEAMLREIEGMGMTPEAEKAAEVVSAPEKTVVPEATTEEMEALEEMIVAEGFDPDAELIAAIAAVEEKAKASAPKAKAAETKPPVEDFVKVERATVTSEYTEVGEPVTMTYVSTPTPTDPENVIKKDKAPAAAVRPASSTDILDPEQVKRDIAINPTDLDTALIQHPGMQLHYALKTADARRAYERLKSGVEILEAQLDSSYRDKLADGAGKKPTEAAIRNALVADPKYASAQAKLIDAQHLWKMCEAVESSFHSRKDILLEVARDRRKEKEGSMRILDDTELRERVLAGIKK